MILPEAEALYNIAEIAVGLAGFAGVVLAISRGREELVSYDAFRVFQLLANAISAMLLALVPIALYAAGVPMEDTWRASSGVMVLVTLGIGAGAFRFGREVDPEDLHWAIGSVLIGGTSINLTCQTLNVLHVGFHGIFAVYYFGLFWFLTGAGMSFVTLLFIRPKQH
jgi:hypothetical protein